MYVLEQEHCYQEPLSTQKLLLLLQDAAGAHCEQIGLGKAVTESRRLMWVVVRQLVEMERWPEPGEPFRLLTWPGDTRHMFYPRFYRLETGSGEYLGQSSAMWTLVDRDSRKMIRPTAYGLEIQGLVTGWEARLPGAPDKLPLEHREHYTVTAAVLDSNGHMNNTRYYQLSETVLGQTLRGKRLVRAVTEYVSEALEGETMTLDWGQDGDRYYITGSLDAEKTFFRMGLEYNTNRFGFSAEQ